MRTKPKSDPPHHIEAERTLLGAILIDNATLDAVAPLITPEAFYRPAHRLIFSALVALHAKDTPIDLVTLRTELAAGGNLDAAGGVAYLGGLVDGVPHVKNAHAWARLVADAHVLRQLADASDAIGEGVSDARGADEAIDRAESLISSLRRPGAGSGPVTLSSLMGSVAQDIERTAEMRGMTGVPTGFRDLDRLTGGWQAGDLVILGARPGAGKTALTLHFAKLAPTLIESLEMSGMKLMRRMVMAEAGVSRNRIAWGLTEEEWSRLARATSSVGSLPVWIDDPPAITVDSILKRARKISGLRLVMIDYLQLVSPSAKAPRESREQQVAAISAGLKRLAKTLNVTVIALSQINRANEQRKDKRPILSDLRESDSIAANADLVMFVHRESMYGQTEENQHRAELIIAKHRDGPTDTVHLRYVRELTRFMDIEDFEGLA